MDDHIKEIFKRIAKGKEYFDLYDFIDAEATMPHLFAWTNTPEEMIKIFSSRTEAKTIKM